MIFYYLNETEINNVCGAGWCNCRGNVQSGYASSIDCKEYCCSDEGANISVSWTWRKHWWSGTVTKGFCGKASPFPKIDLTINEGRPSLSGLVRPDMDIYDGYKRYSL